MREAPGRGRLDCQPRPPRSIVTTPLFPRLRSGALRGRSLASALLLGATLLTACGGGEQKERPNVFLVVVDTLRKDRLSCYGYERETSPRLDRMAAEGALFLDPNAQASWTRPSMLSLFTGRYVTAFRDQVPEESTTMAEVFERAGYRTLGTVGNVIVSEDAGYARGFQHYDARRAKEGQKQRGVEVGRDAPILLADFWEALDSQPIGEEPVFGYLHMMDPHAPYLRHERLEQTMPIGRTKPLDDWHKKQYQAGLSELPESKEREDSWRRVRANRGRYDHEIVVMDEHLALFLDGLEEHGLLENAIVAFVSDHGEVLWERRNPNEMWAKDAPTLPKEVMHGEHGWFITQELIATPFVLWGSGGPAGVRIEHPVENLDLLPTLLELCDLPSPGELHGESLVPYMQGEAESEREYVFSFVVQRSCVREVATGWKLSLPEPGMDGFGVEPELFLLPEDPLERDNRYTSEPEVAERLTEVLAQWKRDYPTVSSAGRALGEEERANLEALGYLGDDDGAVGTVPVETKK